MAVGALEEVASAVVALVAAEMAEAV